MIGSPRNDNIVIGFSNIESANDILARIRSQCDYPEAVKRADKLVCVYVSPEGSDHARLLYGNFCKKLKDNRGVQPFFEYRSRTDSTRIAFLPASMETLEEIVGAGIIVADETKLYEEMQPAKGKKRQRDPR